VDAGKSKKKGEKRSRKEGKRDQLDFFSSLEKREGKRSSQNNIVILAEPEWEKEQHR